MVRNSIKIIFGHQTLYPLIIAGLTVPTVGCNALATGGPLIDKIVTVSEAWISIAILRCRDETHAVTNPGLKG